MVRLMRHRLGLGSILGLWLLLGSACAVTYIPDAQGTPRAVLQIPLTPVPTPSPQVAPPAAGTPQPSPTALPATATPQPSPTALPATATPLPTPTTLPATATPQPTPTALRLPPRSHRLPPPPRRSHSYRAPRYGHAAAIAYRAPGYRHAAAIAYRPSRYRYAATTAYRAPRYRHATAHTYCTACDGYAVAKSDAFAANPDSSSDASAATRNRPRLLHRHLVVRRRDESALR